MSYTHQPYAGEPDYPQMRALLRQIFALNGPPDYCTVGELDWWRSFNTLKRVVMGCSRRTCPQLYY